jgi:hypothetical protein
MTAPSEDDLARQVRLLRGQLARLLSRNLELERQIEDLRREKDEADGAKLALDAASTSIIRSIRLAELAMTAESPQDRRYVVADVEVLFRALFRLEDNRLRLSLPRAELPVPAEYLSNIHMTLAPIPATADTSATELWQALEQAQTVFLRWPHRAGSVAARQAVTLATQLLASWPMWEGQGFGQAMLAFASAADKFGKTLGRTRQKAQRLSYSTAAGRLLEQARALSQARRPTAGNLSQLATAVRELIEQCQALLASHT